MSLENASCLRTYVPYFREIIATFIQEYNTEWLIARLGYQTPARARAAAWAEAA